MMKLIVEANIGETRAALYRGKKCSELYCERWSEAGRPAAGDVFSGRITKVDTSLSAAFVNLGQGMDGFLNFTLAPGAPRLREGQMIRVRIGREGEAHKGPLLSFIEISEAQAPIQEQGGDLISRLKALYPDIVIQAGQVDGFDAALETDIALKGGGSIAIEPTRAITAIDVDTGLGSNKKSVSIAAAGEAIRQIRLRGIGGLILIDFPNFRKKKDRDDIWQTLKDHLDNDPVEGIKLAPLSRFGTVEISRPKSRRALSQICLNRHGLPTAETVALGGLRQLEREGRQQGGAQLELGVPQNGYDWLMADHINWREPLTQRLGARFTVNPAATLYVSRDRP